MPSRSPSCDIFCAIVDNFGDAGVCWRLARQLVNEQGYAVRLWVDDIGVLHSLCPEIDPGLPRQQVRGVDVRRWSEPFPPVASADIVLEGFGSKLPDAYLAAMVAREPQPVWINLEYLSAEKWVDEHHVLPSTHPRLPLVKYFFFPGFTDRTGGLPIERGLDARRVAFQRDSAVLEKFWMGIGLAPPAPEELRISLFAYDNAALPDLLKTWIGGAQPVVCVAPQGKSTDQLSRILGRTFNGGDTWREGSLEVRAISFMEQDWYDYLLWACDINFVRGEDSFVRAQLAARPFVWNIYPQDDDAHLVKLRAFLDIYCGGLSGPAASGLRTLWEIWNLGGAGVALMPQAWQAWQASLRHLGELRLNASLWEAGLSRQGRLAEKLAQFCRAKLK